MEWSVVGRARELDEVMATLRAGRNVLLAGEAGIGKTRLMSALLDLCRADGAAVERITGSATTRTIPFATVAHLLDETRAADQTVLLRFVREQLIEQAAGKQLVIGVDDINLVDRPTLAVLRSLADDDTRVIATARSSSASEPDVLGLWKDGILERVDVAALDRTATTEFAQVMLSGPISLTLSRRLWELSQGNPLFARELVLSIKASGQLENLDGTWDIEGDFTPSERLHDIVRSRVEALAATAHRALGVVALTEPAEMELLDALSVSSAAVQLERDRLVLVERIGGELAMRCAHPLIGEIVRDQMGAMEREQLLGDIANAFGSLQVRPSAALRASILIVDAGKLPAPDLALAGAVAALQRFDADAAARLANCVLTQRSDPAANVALGRALSMQGRHDEACEQLEHAFTTATAQADIAAAASALAENAVFGQGDPDAADRYVQAGVKRIEARSAKVALQSYSLMAAGLAGDFMRALEQGDRLVSADLPAEAAVPSLMIYSLAQAMTGRSRDIHETISRAESLVEDVKLLYPLAQDQLALNRVLGHQARAELSQATALTVAVIDSDSFAERLSGPWLYINAPTHFLTGDLDTAVTETTESIKTHQRLDPIGTYPMALALGAIANAMIGDIRGAQSLIDQAMADPRSSTARIQIWLQLAEAWAIANESSLDDAASTACIAGQQAIDASHSVWGATALHAAVRFGRPDLAQAELAAIATDAGELVQLFAAHADAAVRCDPESLGKVAVDFEQIGAWAAAIDCWAAQAIAFSTGPHADRADTRARDLGLRCPSYRAPLLKATTPALSERVTEVARLAATGLSSKDISRHLHVSVRTVDNHLRQSYATLDVAGRSELREIFVYSAGSP